MSVRVAPKTETVSRCVPLQGGKYLILTRQKSSAVAASELPEGTRVLIREGIAERAAT